MPSRLRSWGTAGAASQPKCKCQNCKLYAHICSLTFELSEGLGISEPLERTSELPGALVTDDLLVSHDDAANRQR